MRVIPRLWPHPPSDDTKPASAGGFRVNTDLPRMRAQQDRDHAHRLLPMVLRVHALPPHPQAQAWRLLRVLLVCVRTLPVDPGLGRGWLLRGLGQAHTDAGFWRALRRPSLYGARPGCRALAYKCCTLGTLAPSCLIRSGPSGWVDSSDSAPGVPLSPLACDIFVHRLTEASGL